MLVHFGELHRLAIPPCIWGSFHSAIVEWERHTRIAEQHTTVDPIEDMTTLVVLLLVPNEKQRELRLSHCRFGCESKRLSHSFIVSIRRPFPYFILLIGLRHDVLLQILSSADR